MQYIADVVRPISSLFSLKLLVGCLLDEVLVRTWNIYVLSGFILAQDPNKAPFKYKSTELQLRASQCTLLILILVTILKYFVLRKYNAAMSIMEYFMYVDEVTSFSYYPVLSH
jgi:hypothetical protein